MKRFVGLMLIAVLLLSSFAIVAVAPHNNNNASAALSGQCHYSYWSPWNNGDSTVRSRIELYCTAAHTRESETCLYFYKFGYVHGPYCQVSGEYYGTEFDATAVRYTYSSSNCTVQAWYWMDDYSTGETWQVWSNELQLWRCPS